MEGEADTDRHGQEHVLADAPSRAVTIWPTARRDTGADPRLPRRPDVWCASWCYLLIVRPLLDIEILDEEVGACAEIRSPDRANSLYRAT